MTLPTVVLLHGLGRTHRSFSKLRQQLEAHGYPTWARSYPSRRASIVELAQDLAGRIRADLGDATVGDGVIGVTHSLGGILARHMTQLLPWRALVMIAPPNNGSGVAERLAGRRWFQWLNGPVGQQLARPDAWPAPPEPFAVIAGTRHRSLGCPTGWLTSALGVFDSRASDGTVAVHETQLPGMSDFATVHASHTWILDHPRTALLVLQFLRTGRFGT